MQPTSVGIMLVILTAFKCSMGMLKQIYSLKWRGFKWFLFWMPTLILSWFLLMVSLLWVENRIWISIVLAVLFIGALLFLIPVRLRQEGTFYLEVDREYKAKMWLTGLLLLQVVEKPSRIRKRPWLFRSSQRLFRKRTPANGLTEALIKQTFRNQRERLSYVQFIMISSIGAGLAPETIRIIVWVAIACLLTLWVKMNVKEGLQAPFLRLFFLEDWDKIQAVRKSVFWISSVLFAPISLAAGVASFGWAGIVLGPLAGAAAAFIASQLFTTW
ncbi:ABC transporter permease [Paenibacillus larvae]|nr:ABC transporter permease [Paenibacillus larvae]